MKGPVSEATATVYHGVADVERNSLPVRLAMVGKPGPITWQRPRSCRVGVGYRGDYDHTSATGHCQISRNQD